MPHTHTRWPRSSFSKLTHPCLLFTTHSPRAQIRQLSHKEAAVSKKDMCMWSELPTDVQKQIILTLGPPRDSRVSHEWLILTRVVHLEIGMACIDRLSSQVDAISRRIVELQRTAEALQHPRAAKHLAKYQKSKDVTQFTWATLVVSFFRTLDEPAFLGLIQEPAWMSADELVGVSTQVVEAAPDAHWAWWFRGR